MTDVASQPKPTPGRRRPGRNQKPGGQKAYASENDAAGSVPYYHGTPQTPNKAASGSAAYTGSQNAHGNSTQRNKNKGKPKNTPASPESSRQTRQTPPPRSASMKSTAAPAFAGATFHASPAPSSLPMPSFLSKLPAQSPRAPNPAVQQPSPPATDTDAPTPSHPSAKPQSLESPLDFMFRAHRQEQVQQRQDSPYGPRPTVPNTASPASRSAFEFNDPSKGYSAPPARRPDMRRSASGIDSAELDGTPGRPMGPAFSTPYQDRIRAARSNANRPEGSADPNPNHKPAAASDDPTEALKKFLFSGPSVSRTNAAGSGAGPGAAATAQGQAHMHAAPPPAPQMSGPTQGPQGHSHNIKAMENDLRRILKMDAGPNPGPPQQGFFTR